MEQKQRTPRQKARLKYEQVHKEERDQATKQFNTRLPKEEYDEIVALLNKYNIPKVEVIRMGYRAFLETKQDK